MNSGGDWCSISVGSLEERAGFTGTGTAVEAMEVEVEEEAIVEEEVAVVIGL